MNLSNESIIREKPTIQQIEEGTEVYVEGEPFIIDHSPYSTYLFIFSNMQFLVYAVGIEKAIGLVKQFDEFSTFCWLKEKYSIIHLSRDQEWHGSNFDQSKRIIIVNDVARSLFNKNIS